MSPHSTHSARSALPESVTLRRMSKAHVDPAELRRFAQDLARFNNDLQTLVAGLNGRMRNLETSWRDQEQRKFAEAFDQTVKAFGNFLETSNQHGLFLGKKAALIEEYFETKVV